MKRYLKTIRSDEALQRILDHVNFSGGEEYLQTYKCRERISSRSVYAHVSNPPFMCAAMDGYAVDFSKTIYADLSRPLSLMITRDAIPVNTGDPLPDGTNAVIMIEDIEDADTSIAIRKPVYLWQNVRMIGEDIVEGDMLIPANHEITAYDIGMLISGGITHIHVRKKPRALIVPTGKELIDLYNVEEPVNKLGGLVDFNSYTLLNLAEETGLDCTISQIAETKEDLYDIIKNAINAYDLIFVNAGSSAGREDYTEEVISKQGELIFHGISMMPGKPAMFGVVDGKPVFGIPGYPVSAALIFYTFIKPLYEKMMHSSKNTKLINCKTTYKIPSRLGIEEIIRVSLVENDGIYYAIPLPRGASIFSSMARADGLMRVPVNIEGFEEGDTIACELLTKKETLKQRIHIIGSHDLSLDILRDMIKTHHTAFDLNSTHTGSLSGITALSKGIAHICTTHILDENEKIYNVPAIKKYLADKPCVLIHIAKRLQGLIVRKGNKKNIKGISDLSRPEVKFINRQSGSGTRILLDMLLSENDIEKHHINGYDREESTHTAVGIQVRESIADTGIAIYSIARVFSLDFIPLAEEDYDLLVTKEFTEDRRFKLLMDMVNSNEFRQRLEKLGGYNTKETGRIKFTNG
ncbi:MAG TPA: molybdopterin biosynthesis protein [Syntrophorhabdaceae bacterium]|nr:molybdopterin biosynthesis protein [Syntrophorhabdaceae bacterium]